MRSPTTISALSTPLLMLALSGCGLKLASPALGVQIPIRPELRECIALSAPDGRPAPAGLAAAADFLRGRQLFIDDASAALAAKYALHVQFDERRYWSRREIGHAESAAVMCLRNIELAALIDGANEAAKPRRWWRSGR